MLTLLLTACWQGKPVGKTWTKEALLAYAVDTIKARTPSADIPCRSAALNGLQACFAVHGPIGSIRTPADKAFGEELHQLADWEFVGGGGAATYVTRGGEALELGLVYGADDGDTIIMEKLPKGAQGVLHVFVESSQFQK